MIRGIVIGFLTMVTLALNGQISVSVNANADTIKFGDVVELTYKINVPNGVDVTSLDFSDFKSTSNLIYESYPEEVDSIMDIDIVDGGVFNISNTSLVSTKAGVNQPLPLQGTVKIRVSSVGAILLPKPKVGHLSGVQEIPLQSPFLFIKPQGGIDDLNPNWDIILEEGRWTDFLPYLYIFFGIVIFIISIYLIVKLLKPKPKGFNVEKIEVIIPAHEKAHKDLSILKEKELWQNGETKAYHSELTRIMRQYIEDRYEIQALEMTSNQLRKELSVQNIDAGIVKRFDDILQIADIVKFAKGDAGPEINVKFMDESFRIVEETKVINVDKEGEE